MASSCTIRCLFRCLAGLVLVTLIVTWRLDRDGNTEAAPFMYSIFTPRTLSIFELPTILRETITDLERKSEWEAQNWENIISAVEKLDNISSHDKLFVLSFLLQPIINNYNFTFSHRSYHACVYPKTEILFVIPSAPENVQRRNKLRSGEYGKFIKNLENRAQLLFFLGKSDSQETQGKIHEESMTFNDIIQESFEDTYRNVRYKAVSMLRWVSLFCLQASYVIRNDDDVEANLTSLTDALRRTGRKYENFILGSVRLHDFPCRNASKKSYLSRNEYRKARLPPFALSGLQGYPVLTVRLLYQAALRVKPIWLDDVFITGMCAPRIGAKLLNDSAFDFKREGKMAV